MPPPTSKPPDKNVDHDTPAPHPNLTWDDLGFRMHYKDLSKMVLVETEHVGETGPLLTHVHWKNAEIQVLPYAELTIDPCATALNYGQSIFEGTFFFATICSVERWEDRGVPPCKNNRDAESARSRTARSSL